MRRAGTANLLQLCFEFVIKWQGRWMDMAMNDGVTAVSD